MNSEGSRLPIKRVSAPSRKAIHSPFNEKNPSRFSFFKISCHETAFLATSKPSSAEYDLLIDKFQDPNGVITSEELDLVIFRALTDESNLSRQKYRNLLLEQREFLKGIYKNPPLELTSFELKEISSNVKKIETALNLSPSSFEIRDYCFKRPVGPYDAKKIASFIEKKYLEFLDPSSDLKLTSQFTSMCHKLELSEENLNELFKLIPEVGSGLNDSLNYIFSVQIEKIVTERSSIFQSLYRLTPEFKNYTELLKLQLENSVLLKSSGESIDGIERKSFEDLLSKQEKLKMNIMISEMEFNRVKSHIIMNNELLRSYDRRINNLVDIILLNSKREEEGYDFYEFHGLFEEVDEELDEYKTVPYLMRKLFLLTPVNNYLQICTGKGKDESKYGIINRAVLDFLTTTKEFNSREIDFESGTLKRVNAGLLSIKSNPGRYVVKIGEPEERLPALAYF